MKIEVNPELESELNDGVAAGNHATPSDYVNNLILRDWVTRHHQELETRAQASIDSGPATPLPSDWKQRVVAETRARLDRV